MLFLKVMPNLVTCHCKATIFAQVFLQVTVKSVTSIISAIQVTMDDFELSCRGLYRALTIREKYMRLAYQRFPRTASQYLRDIEGETFKTEDQVQPGEEKRQCGSVGWWTWGLNKCGYARCFLYHWVSQMFNLYVTSIHQSSHLLQKTGKTPLIPRTCQRIWDMLPV